MRYRMSCVALCEQRNGEGDDRTHRLDQERVEESEVDGERTAEESLICEVANSRDADGFGEIFNVRAKDELEWGKISTRNEREKQGNTQRTVGRDEQA
jgi:hypothetical protein